ncbi:uncharacterized protein LOC125418674 [Ziziphus jujuba]|uniref:Uncharacterized protein LOC125418674 n=1 Tax=Ziziphus jujuba TaxID=326968 RepID=A0ABM3I1N5_ZIZJJ|nr:uncharacterized protein LOC125418674 [Ziziphus jujuba]
MNRPFKKSQILMLSLLAILLVIAPLLSSSLRPTYLYFIINFLIIALGAEAGLLSFFSKPYSDDKKNTSLAHQKPAVVTHSVPDHKKGSAVNSNSKPICSSDVDREKVVPECDETTKANKVVERSMSEKTTGSVRSSAERVKKCPSTPSLFFIGGGEAEAEMDINGDNYYQEEVEVEEEEEEVGEISGQELFAKAETFIGNFYKQLKMQREESWKRIHGFYQRAF